MRKAVLFQQAFVLLLTHRSLVPLVGFKGKVSALWWYSYFYFIVFYCSVLLFIVLYCIAFYCIVLFFIVLYCFSLFCILFLCILV